MRNHLRFFGSLLLVATLCVPNASFAQTNAEEYGNVEEYGDPMNAPANDSLDSTNDGERFDIQLPGDADYAAASIAAGDDDEMNSWFVYGGLLMLALLGIGMLILANKARRRPPQRIQL